MILVDTSIWVDHLSHEDAKMRMLLREDSVLCHPFVIGELALGNLKHRDAVLEKLRDLPQAAVAHDEEVMRFIDYAQIAGSGVGYVDAHLLAAVKMTLGTLLWTRDKRLHLAAKKLGFAMEVPA